MIRVAAPVVMESMQAGRVARAQGGSWKAAGKAAGQALKRGLKRNAVTMLKAGGRAAYEKARQTATYKKAKRKVGDIFGKLGDDSWSSPDHLPNTPSDVRAVGGL